MEKKRKKIVLGVSGGIAAYKTYQLVSDLIKKDYHVDVIMTKNALEFINALTFETLTKQRVMTDTFDAQDSSDIPHIRLAKEADLFIIAPATANIIAKMAVGIADDMLTSTILPATCPILVAPAMNTYMYNNPITQRNIQTLKEFGYDFIEPEVGLLACGDSGIGKLASNDTIIDAIDTYLSIDKPLMNKKILITAGPTIEKLDPVRFLTNHSSGKMGYALAKQAKALGANVTLISGPCNLDKPTAVNFISVESSAEMYQEVKKHFKDQDIIIKAAAVTDFTFEEYVDQKIKKTDNLSFNLKKTTDILAYLGENKQAHQVLCGFAMETDNLIEEALKKLLNKNCDLIVANLLNEAGAGFKHDTNKVTIVKQNKLNSLPVMRKEQVAKIILDECLNIHQSKVEE
jgi:phosphopantothenoylcysteine decarboxylase/phosphopantothenate--cysteine ligase, prokaryotic